MTLTPNGWLRALTTSDQIVDFLCAKGSIIKFCIVESDGDHQELSRQLTSFCREHKLNFLSADSNAGDVSRPEMVVRQIAGQVSTEQYIDSFARQVWNEAGFPNPELAPFDRVAKINGLEKAVLAPLVPRTMQQLLPTSSEYGHVPAFNRDFRNALLRIAGEILQEGQSSPMRRQLIAGFESWLAGVAPAHILKMLGIQWKLKRTNATQLLRSILALPVLIGVNGSVLHLDFRTITNPELLAFQPQIRYTRRTRTTVFQWLRELIDQTHMFDSTMMIVEVGPSFLDQSATGSGIGSYDALKFRVLDDVSTEHDNPSSVITRLSSRDFA